MTGILQDAIKASDPQADCRPLHQYWWDLGLAITMAAGEWRGKTFSENLYILTGALTIGGAGMKGLQKFSERDEKPVSNSVAPTTVAASPTVTVPSTEVVSTTSKVIKVQTPEKELTAVLQEGW